MLCLWVAGNWEMEAQFVLLEDFGVVQNVGQGEGTASPHCSAETQTLGCRGYLSKKHHLLLH